MKQFRYVLVVATEGSISKAADALGISQPSLSQYLKKIEQEVHATLFDRSGTQIRLTDAGQTYLDAGRRILAIERQMEGRIADIADLKTGTLIVGISPHRAIGLMPDAIKQFHTVYPGISVVIEERTGAALLEETSRGAFDLCITTAPVDQRLFFAEKIMDEEVVLAAPSASPLTGRKDAGRTYPVIDLQTIQHKQLITLADTQIMQQMLDRICHNYEITYCSAVTVTSIEAQLAMVKAGLGYAVVPAGAGRFENQGLAYYSFAQELPAREIVCVYRKEQYLSHAARAFMDVLKQLDNRDGNNI